MSDNLTRLPDYTCLETIERLERVLPARRFDLMDTVRLEVGLINGKEMFSWPGATTFDDKPVDQFVLGGIIGNGNFALHAKMAFQSNVPRFTYGGEQMLNGRRTLLWNYTVSRKDGGFVVRTSNHQAVLGSHGSFWVDRETLDVIRLEVEAADIPPELELTRVGNSVNYMRARIGDASFLLPREAELQMIDLRHLDSLNRLHFSSCRQYLGESKVSFGEPTEGVSAAQPLRTVELPVESKLYLVLQTPIQSGVSTTGDALTFELQQDVNSAGVTLFRKGSLVRGRLVLLRRYKVNKDGYAVGVQLREIESGSARATVNAKLDEIPLLPNEVYWSAYHYRQLLSKKGQPESAGSFFFQEGKSVKLPKGTSMAWQTVSESQAIKEE